MVIILKKPHLSINATIIPAFVDFFMVERRYDLCKPAISRICYLPQGGHEIIHIKCIYKMVAGFKPTRDFMVPVTANCEDRPTRGGTSQPRSPGDGPGGAPSMLKWGP